jgi:hypothetical protein
MKYKIKSVAELQLQKQCVRHFEEYYPEHSHLLIALPNGFKSQFDYKTNKNIKELGFKKDTPDLFLAIKSNLYSGLFIELVPCGERLTKKKYEYLEKLRMNNYKVAIVKDVEGFTISIKNYLYNL